MTTQPDPSAPTPSRQWANLFYRDPRLLALTLGLIVVAGLGAYNTLPRMEDPVLVKRNAYILTRLPGADAERVEALVTEKIEDELNEIEEIKTIESTSRVGISVIMVELHDSVSRVEAVWSRVRDKLNDVEPQLPATATKPALDELDITAYSLIAGVTWNLDGPAQYAILRRVAEELEDALRALPGTAEVDVAGDPNEEVEVAVDADRIAALHLTLEDVAQAMSRADAKVTAGQLRNARSDFLVEVAGEVNSLDRVRNLPIRSGADGQLVRLADVATVRKTIADPPSDLALVGGKASVVVAVRLEDQVRIDDWARDAEHVLASFQQRLPRGLELDVIFDQSRYVAHRLDGLAWNMLISMSLVVLVILVMMGWKSAIAVGAALPLASLIVLAGLKALGVPLQQMSVTGLIIALGLLIDNAIVMVDEVSRRRNEGRSTADAIAYAVTHLAIPLAGSTFTTALAFLPIVLMPGGAGEFVGSIGLSVILAITASFFLAMTITPALAGVMERIPLRGPRGRWWVDGVSLPRISPWYHRTLRAIFARPWLGVGIAVILPVIGFYKASELEEQFFPSAERDQFQVVLWLPNQASLEQTQATVAKARAALLADPQIERVHWFFGTNAPKFYYNMMSGQDDSAFYAQALVQIRDAQQATATVRRAQEVLDAALPGVLAVARELEQGPPFSAPIEVRIYGPDLDVLRALGDEVRTQLAAITNVTQTRATLEHGRPKLLMQLDEPEARMAGLDNVGVARQLAAQLDGATGGSLLEATEELPLRARLKRTQRGDVADLASVDLLSNAMPPTLRPGQDARPFVPLAALGDLALEPELASIPHRDGQRLNTVQGYVEAGVLPNSVLRQLRATLANGAVAFPAGYRYEFGGESAERDRAVGNLMASVSVLAALMAASLVLSFHSFRIAGILAVLAALSVGLGMGSLWVWGYPFGFMAIVGTMGLIGVAVNDSIVVLAAIKEEPRAASGDVAAVSQVVHKATRHVWSTTITTCVGFTPLLVQGGGFWPPLAVTIATGVLGSTLLALYFTPAAYLILCTPRRKRASATSPEHVASATAFDEGELAPAASIG